jgi:hypothetical protein
MVLVAKIGIWPFAADSAGFAAGASIC